MPAKNQAELEPRVRLVLSPNGIERVEVWGRTDAGQQQALELFFRLTRKLREVNEVCRAGKGISAQYPAKN